MLKNILILKNKTFYLLKKSLGKMKTTDKIALHLVNSVMFSDPSLELCFSDFRKKTGFIELELWDRKDTVVHLLVDCVKPGEIKIISGHLSVLDEDFIIKARDLKKLKLSDNVTKKVQELNYEVYLDENELGEYKPILTN